MRAILNFARAITFASIVAALFGCIAAEPAGEFSTALGKLIRSERVHEVDLAKVLPLDWDELFAFGPYSTRESNCRALQLGWLKCRTTLPAEVSESEFVLVFRADSKVVHVERHRRWNGDFNSLSNPRPQPILRSAAKFSVRPVSNRASESEPWYQLEHEARH
jgi:hypothetical protein